MRGDHIRAGDDAAVAARGRVERRYSTKECKEEGSCGKLNVNTIRWSPHNRLLLLGVRAAAAREA